MRLKHYLSCMLILLSFVTVNAQEKKELKEGDQAPTFKYLDINGKEVSLSDLKGKYVYIDVWATWCGPCQYELPHLNKLYEGSEKSKYTCKYCGQTFNSISSMTSGNCIRHPNGTCKGRHAPAL